MRIREKIWTDREDLKIYRSRIDGDSFFLKAQLVFSSIFMLFLLGFFLWYF